MSIKHSSMVLTIIGSGSTYTPELIDGIIARRESIHFREIRLMDIDERKRTIVGNLCQRMISAANVDSKVILMEDLDEALMGADFVITQIRVGKLPARAIDESIPLKYDLIAQETTGIGGFFKALRTIPVVLHIAKRMEELCPNAFLINFTNPSGIVTQAVNDYSKIRVIGLCNAPIVLLNNIQEKLGLEEMKAEFVGLNHLTWITKIESGGKDYLPQAIEEGLNAVAPKNIKATGFSVECLKAAQGIPGAYLEYFYNRDKKLAEQKAATKSRAEVCMELEEEILRTYEDTELHVKPKQLDQRGGAKYSLVAISLIDAIANDKKEIHIVDVKNQGALSFLRDEDVIEIACVIDANGATPIHLPNFHNEHIETLMQTVKSYERHTVTAAVNGDEIEAMRALMVHPLVGDFNTASACFTEMKEAHARYLPQFYKSKEEGAV